MTEQSIDPLAELAAEYHRINREMAGGGFSDEVAEQCSERTHAITLKMLDLKPTTVGGATAILGVVHYEIREGLLWDEHHRMIKTAMDFFEQFGG